MAGRPKFRVYVSGEDGKIDFKQHEFCALWENTSRAGDLYYSGKTKDGRKVQMWLVKEAPPQPAAADKVPLISGDVPF